MPASNTCSTTERRASFGLRPVVLLIAALLVGTAGCGYRAVRLSTPVVLEAVQGEVPVLDALPAVETALRRALRAVAPLETSDGSEQRLRVRVIEAQARLSSFSEPALRAGQYDAQVRLQAEILDPFGQTQWRREVSGNTPFLSPPGGLDSLDGAARRALQRAADEAARRLVEVLLDREGGDERLGPPVSTSSGSDGSAVGPRVQER